MTSSNKNNNYIPWLNGLKGFACISVLLHHWFAATRNGAIFGSVLGKENLSAFEICMSSEPIGFILNGNFQVCIFLLVSAFLISRQIFSITASSENAVQRISNVIIKRYFRLLFPVGFYCLLDWVLLKVLTATGLNYINKVSELSFFKLISHILVRVWAMPDNKMLGPLWMMTYLFIGSFVAVLLSLMHGKDRKHMWLFYLLATGLLLFANPYYMISALGVDLAYLTEKTDFKKVIISFKPYIKIVIGLVLLALGIILGGYPSYYISDNLYSYLNPLSEAIVNFYVVMHGLGAFFIVLSIYFLKPLDLLFSSKPFQFLGNVSMGVYLIHSMVVEYLGYYVIDRLKLRMSFIPAFWLTALIIVLITLVLAFISSKTIEKWSERLVKRIV